MSATDFGALSELQKKVWSATTIKQGRDSTFFLNAKNNTLSGGIKDATKPVHYVDELTEVGGGTKCIVPLVLDLSGDGQTGDDKLTGNEEALIADSQEINIGQLRQAVTDTGKFSNQQTVLNFRASARDTLANWIAQKQDEMFFLIGSGVALSKNLDGSTRTSTVWSKLPFAAQVSAPTTEREIFAGTATTTAGLTASDTMAWNLLVNAKAVAVTKRLKPIMVNGNPMFMVVMHPYQGRDLKKDQAYKDASQHAAERGMNNPLFTGSFNRVDGLILFEHNKVTTTFGLSSGSKWGASGTVDGATALLIGAQALGYGFIGNKFSWSEKSETDYENTQGIGVSMMFGVVKNVFKDVYASGKAKRDFAMIAIRTACTPQ